MTVEEVCGNMFFSNASDGGTGTLEPNIREFPGTPVCVVAGPIHTMLTGSTSVKMYYFRNPQITALWPLGLVSMEEAEWSLLFQV